MRRARNAYPTTSCHAPRLVTRPASTGRVPARHINDVARREAAFRAPFHHATRQVTFEHAERSALSGSRSHERRRGEEPEYPRPAFDTIRATGLSVVPMGAADEAAGARHRLSHVRHRVQSTPAGATDRRRSLSIQGSRRFLMPRRKWRRAREHASRHAVSTTQLGGFPGGAPVFRAPRGRPRLRRRGPRDLHKKIDLRHLGTGGAAVVQSRRVRVGAVVSRRRVSGKHWDNHIVAFPPAHISNGRKRRRRAPVLSVGAARVAPLDVGAPSGDVLKRRKKASRKRK